MQRKEFLEKTVIQLDDDLFGEFNCLLYTSDAADE